MFIGPKKIKNQELKGDFVELEYEDGTKEILTVLMFHKISSLESCDLTALRDKRVLPVVAIILGVLKDWGIKLSELPYLGAVLNESWRKSEEEALKLLWKNYNPSLETINDIDLTMVDRVLKEKSVKNNPIPSPFYGNDKPEQPA